MACLRGNNKFMKKPLIILIFGIIICLQVTITASDTKMVLIKGGTFKMGSAKGKGDAITVHDVKINDFYMDVHEVTQKNYKALMNLNPSKFFGEDRPVERVRWMDAAYYCNARSEKDGLKPCYNTETWECDFTANGYRLPTEAEWEYACRGGTTGDYFFKDGTAKLQNYAWFRENSREKTHPVATKQPNPYGLFDILGNVAEWCNDNYGEDYYSVSPKDNPKGPEVGKKKVLRGGSWQSRSKYCTVYQRFSDAPATPDICQGYDHYGFRCVRKVEE